MITLCLRLVWERTTVLARRWPDLRLSAEAEFSEGFVIRGLKSLPIEF